MNQQADRSSDGQIMDRLSRGDESAITWLVEHVVPDIWPLLRRRFKDSLSDQELEEVVSNALLKFWNNRKVYDAQKGELHGWFYVIARNAALDVIRDARRREQRLAGPVLIVEGSGGTTIGYTERDECVAKAFARLNERERKVVAPLFQSDQEQSSVRDLGRKLKLSEGGVRVLRFRGLRKLKQVLSKMGYRLIRQTAKKSRPE